MKNTIKMDAAGRIVIPQRIRERYGLDRTGHYLEILESPEGILLRPEPQEIPAERQASGWIVFRSGEDECVDPVRAVEAERERRDSAVSKDAGEA